MGCYHFHLNQLSRGKGQSAIASAAYRAGTKLECTYYGEVSDYTRKGGVVLAEIHLPKQAPERFKDREILWNEVEWIEGNKKAQLAHSFDITLMNEFSIAALRKEDKRIHAMLRKYEKVKNHVEVLMAEEGEGVSLPETNKREQSTETKEAVRTMKPKKKHHGMEL